MLVTVISAFCVFGVRKDAGSVVDLPDADALDLVHRGKAVIGGHVHAPAPAEPAPAATPRKRRTTAENA